MITSGVLESVDFIKLAAGPVLVTLDLLAPLRLVVQFASCAVSDPYMDGRVSPAYSRFLLVVHVVQLRTPIRIGG